MPVPGRARNDVAFLINRDVGEAKRLKATHQILGALVFMKGRRFHFRNGDLIGKRDFFIAQNRCKGFLDRRQAANLSAEAVTFESTGASCLGSMIILSNMKPMTHKL